MWNWSRPLRVPLGDESRLKLGCSPGRVWVLCTTAARVLHVAPSISKNVAIWRKNSEMKWLERKSAPFNIHHVRTFLWAETCRCENGEVCAANIQSLCKAAKVCTEDTVISWQLQPKQFFPPSLLAPGILEVWLWKSENQNVSLGY